MYSNKMSYYGIFIFRRSLFDQKSVKVPEWSQNKKKMFGAGLN